MSNNEKQNLADKKANAVSRRSSDEVNDLRKRMVTVKQRLPKGAVTTLISLHPEFNAYKKSSRVRLVFNLSIVDEDITQKFEALADLTESEKAKGNIGVKKS